MTVLPVKILLKTIFRSFFIQASWNFRSLQSLGYLFVALPALRFFYHGEELQNACARYMEKFNTHPYMAGPIIGMCLALEAGEDDNIRIEAQELKEMTMSPYAAMGDAFFWGGVKPLAVVISLFAAVKGSLWAPVLFFALYNLPHLGCRIGGLWQGYVKGMGMIHAIQRWRLPDLAIHLKEATVVLLGCFSAYLIAYFLEMEHRHLASGLLFIPFLWGSNWLFRKGLSSLAGVLLLVSFCYLLSLFWI